MTQLPYCNTCKKYQTQVNNGKCYKCNSEIIYYEIGTNFDTTNDAKGVEKRLKAVRANSKWLEEVLHT